MDHRNAHADDWVVDQLVSVKGDMISGLRRALSKPVPTRTQRLGARLGAEDSNDSWPQVPLLFRARTAPLPAPWEDVFGPLRVGNIDDLVVVAQIGQSIDGRVATTTGQSHYINCPAGIAHLHRLRALVDGVVIGVQTACADDPQLTVRRVRGPNPVRVVLDPHGRLSPNARLLSREAETILVIAEGGDMAPSAILAGLAKLGLRRVLVEGGANTVSRFLQARCLDRLHVVVAPLILGSGRPSFAFGAIDRLEEAMRPPVRTHQLDRDMLFDCDLSAQRVPVWRAQKST
jgi:diaminohydroxyphosphoribosylaminopyrimidine deaminase / 5-amino-6-(5-phosphoribosylamino)uracil reductase